MSAVTNVYGDITPRQAAYSVKTMLKRAQPYLVLEKFGQVFVLPANNTKTAKFRRYNALDPTPVALVEGVTPDGKPLTVTDVTCTLTQYGDFVRITDVIQETHEDPVLQQASELCGEQSAQLVEIVRFNTIKAGTNVIRAGGVATRDLIKDVLTADLQKKAVRALKRQNARPITKVVTGSPNYATEPVAASYIGFVHPDLESDIQAMTGFVPVEKYGTISPYENEVGKVGNVRYLSSTIFSPWADAGSNADTDADTTLELVSTGGVKADVYPVIIIGADSYGMVPLKGKNAIVPCVVNIKPAAGDELGQRGSVGWKTMQNSVILNDAWMVRIEVACTNL